MGSRKGFLRANRRLRRGLWAHIRSWSVTNSTFLTVISKLSLSFCPISLFWIFHQLLVVYSRNSAVSFRQNHFNEIEYGMKERPLHVHFLQLPQIPCVYCLLQALPNPSHERNKYLLRSTKDPRNSPVSHITRLSVRTASYFSMSIFRS